MTKREIAALACKILGIYAIITALRHLVNIVGPLAFFGVGEPSWEIKVVLLIAASIIPFALLTGFGLFLWFQADRIAGYMISGEESQIVNFQTSFTDVQAIAFSVVGLLLLAEVVPDIAAIISNLSIRTQSPEIQMTVNAGTRSLIISLVVRLVIGLWLFFGSRGLVGLLRLTRESGSNKIKE